MKFSWSQFDDGELVQASGLFDEAYYQRQCWLLMGKLSPVEHFLQYGWQKRLSPSPFFDTAYYLERHPELIDTNVCPLIDFLRGWRVHFRDPNALFKTSFYLEQVPGKGEISRNPVAHYLAAGDRLINPHPLFDSQFYLAENPDVYDGNELPWRHYLLHGRFEGRQPNALFSARHYAEQLKGEIEFSAALEHYIEQGWAGDTSPMVYFNQVAYKNLFVSEKDATLTPLEHFFAQCEKSGASLGEGLTAIFGEITESLSELPSSAPLSFNALRLVRDERRNRSLAEINGSQKAVVLFFGHEASRTGAPLILLQLIKHFAESNYACLLILKTGGPLVEDYKQYASVIVLEDRSPKKHQVESIVENLKPSIESGKIVGAIVNTAVNSGLYESFRRHKIYTLTLVHEFLTGFSTESVESLYKDTDQIIFPCQFIKEVAAERQPFGDLPTHVKPQGVLQAEFGLMNREAARKAVRAELGLPEDSFIVLGTGTVDLRKGFDMFVSAAAKVLRENQFLRPIHFVWLGGEKCQPNSIHYFSLWDIERLGISNNFHIVKNRADNEPWFVGADVFFLSSRQDPFPCVVHEAMASAVPVIVFDGSGGAPEMISQGGGTICAFGDIDAVARTILNYVQDETARLSAGAAGRSAVGRYKFTEYFKEIKDLLSV